MMAIEPTRVALERGPSAFGRLFSLGSVRNSTFPRNDQKSLPESGPCMRKIDPLQSFGDVDPSGPCLIPVPPILPILVGVEKPAECPILLAPINVGQVVEIRFLP